MSDQAEQKRREELLRAQEERRQRTASLMPSRLAVDPPTKGPDAPAEAPAPVPLQAPESSAPSTIEPVPTYYLWYRDRAGYMHYSLLGNAVVLVVVVLAVAVGLPVALLAGLVGVALWGILRLFFGDKAD